MSSFKRRVTSKQPGQPRGTRIQPGSTSTYTTSTGIPSLDDILGGGLPLTCLQLILAPDLHSAYGELVQKYFIAQGLSSGHEVIIVGDDCRAFVEECMWTPGAAAASTSARPSNAADDEEDENSEKHDAAIKIAWRYEQMKQFQTTVSSTQSDDNYSAIFDLTCRIPKPAIDDMISTKQLSLMKVPFSEDSKSPVREVLDDIKTRLGAQSPESAAKRPTRICIPSLGSMQWDDTEPHEICYFLHSLRAILRQHPYACASISLPPHMCSDSWGGPGWTQKLGWLSDACISLSAFTGNPSLSAMFSKHHGFVHIHSLPAPLTLIPPSDRLSTLRGLTSSGENNLAFKCMRKRLIFETLHLDVEGGVGERRTTPASSVLDDLSHEGHTHAQSSEPTSSAGATIEIQMEEVQQNLATVAVDEKVSQEDKPKSAMKKTKQRKKVAFTSEGPDLYDF